MLQQRTIVFIIITMLLLGFNEINYSMGLAGRRPGPSSGLAQRPPANLRPSAPINIQRPGLQQPANQIIQAQRPGQPGLTKPVTRPWQPSMPPVYRPNMNIYGGYSYGYPYDYYGGGYIDQVGTVEYATISKQQGTAPKVWCASECVNQLSKKWNYNTYCDNDQCYCECQT